MNSEKKENDRVDKKFKGLQAIYKNEQGMKDVWGNPITFEPAVKERWIKMLKAIKEDKPTIGPQGYDPSWREKTLAYLTCYQKLVAGLSDEDYKLKAPMNNKGNCVQNFDCQFEGVNIEDKCLQ